MCFENQRIFLYALQALGFEAKTFETCVFKAGVRSTDTAHNCTLVTVGDEQFMCDASSGFNGIRYPLKFTPMKPGEKYVVEFGIGEAYELAWFEDYFSLSILAKDRFVGFISSQWPQSFMDDEKSTALFASKFTMPGRFRLRDDAITIGKIIEGGRIGLEFYPN